MLLGGVDDMFVDHVAKFAWQILLHGFTERMASTSFHYDQFLYKFFSLRVGPLPLLQNWCQALSLATSSWFQSPQVLYVCDTHALLALVFASTSFFGTDPGAAANCVLVIPQLSEEIERPEALRKQQDQNLVAQREESRRSRYRASESLHYA
jgi:hypothetical protein